MNIILEIIEWIMIIVAILAMAAIAFGALDMGRSTGDAKMGGSLLIFFGLIALALDAAAYMIKMILEKMFG